MPERAGRQRVALHHAAGVPRRRGAPCFAVSWSRISGWPSVTSLRQRNAQSTSVGSRRYTSPSSGSSPRAFVGRRLAQRNDSPVLQSAGNLARVDLMPKIAVDDPLGPRRRSDRRVLGIDAGDTGDEPVARATDRSAGRVPSAMIEAAALAVPTPVHHRRARRRRSSAGRGTCGTGTASSCLRSTQCWNSPGRSPGVRAELEHRHDDDLDLDGRLSSRRRGRRPGNRRDDERPGQDRRVHEGSHSLFIVLTSQIDEMWRRASALRGARQ